MNTDKNIEFALHKHFLLKIHIEAFCLIVESVGTVLTCNGVALGWWWLGAGWKWEPKVLVCGGWRT